MKLDEGGWTKARPKGFAKPGSLWFTSRRTVRFRVVLLGGFVLPAPVLGAGGNLRNWTCPIKGWRSQNLSQTASFGFRGSRRREERVTQEGLANKLCAAGGALDRRETASSVAPISTDTGAPCVLASRRPAAPGDEARSAKPS